MDLIWVINVFFPTLIGTVALFKKVNEQMKIQIDRYRPLFAVAAILMVCSGSAGPGKPTDICNQQDIVFLPGEEIVYKLFYNWNFIWLAAGEVVFRVKEKEDVYHLSATGRTFGSYEWFFKVRDRYECEVDKTTLRPLRSVRRIEEGKHREYDDTEFDYNRNVAVSAVGKTMEDRQPEEIPVDPCIHDILSCLYQVRNLPMQDLQVDTKVPINIYLDKESFDLDMVYKGQEVKRIKGFGKCNTILLEPEMIVGDVFKDDKGMKIWASDDGNRVPLLIESPVSVGSVKAVLKDYRGSKYPFEPRVRK